MGQRKQWSMLCQGLLGGQLGLEHMWAGQSWGAPCCRSLGRTAGAGTGTGWGIKQWHLLAPSILERVPAVPYPFGRYSKVSSWISFLHSLSAL